MNTLIRQTFTIVLSALLLMPAKLSATNERRISPNGPQTPVTFECIQVCAAKFNVPLALLIGLMAAEGGRVGYITYNQNKSYDMGPMQINSWWLPKLKAINISEESIIHNGCVNVAAAAWLMRYHMSEYPNDIFQAVGRYHSPTPWRASNYAQNVKSRLMRINVKKTIDKANSSIERWN